MRRHTPLVGSPVTGAEAVPGNVDRPPEQPVIPRDKAASPTTIDLMRTRRTSLKKHPENSTRFLMSQSGIS